MAIQLYLRISGIDGPVLAPPAYAKWIKVVAFYWGASQGGGREKISSFNDFLIVKAVDETSPHLFQKCASGEHLAKVQVDWTKSEGKIVTKILECVFKDVLISSMSIGKGNSTTEEVVFNFGEMSSKYENASGNF